MEKTLQNIPFLRLTIALLIGIAIGKFIQLNYASGLILLLFLLSGLIFLNLRYSFKRSTVFGLILNFFFVILGITVFNHYNKPPILHSSGIFVATVLEKPIEKPKSFKTTVLVDNILSNDSILKTKEKLIVYFAKEDSVNELQPGDEILFNRVPVKITPKLNPYDFDYAQYLERRKIYRQVYLSGNDWRTIGKKHFSIVCEAEKLRNKLIEIYRSQPIDSVEFEILSALTLGYSRELDPEVRRVFSSSGAMHVLSVSGLHVAILFGVINFLFGFFKRHKNGRFVFTSAVLTILWFYAFITGLSPSVLRATAMFSVYIIGDNIHRKANIYNSLALTAFFLLLINPNSLFDIGFQLSYAALLGIVIIEPEFRKLLNVKNRLLKYIIPLITVSVAAQIATFPLTSYYFSQFPTYFWLTNIFIIPATGILTPAGIALLFVNQIPVVSGILSFILNFGIKYSYLLLRQIDQLPFSVFHINVNQVQLIVVSCLIISIFFTATSFNARNLKLSLILMLTLCLSILIKQYSMLQNSAFIVYHSPNNPTIHLVNGKNNFIISESLIKPDEDLYNPAIATVKQLGLKKPLLLTSSDSFKSEDLYMKDRIIHFHGCTIFFGRNFNGTLENMNECFFINPAGNFSTSTSADSATIINTKQKFIAESAIENNQIYYTISQGAFQKKW